MLAIANITIVILFLLFYVVVMALFVKVIIVGFVFVSGSIVFFGSTNPLGGKVSVCILVIRFGFIQRSGYGWQEGGLTTMTYRN